MLNGDESLSGLILASNWAAHAGALVPTTMRPASITVKIMARDTRKIMAIKVINLSKIMIGIF